MKKRIYCLLVLISVVFNSFSQATWVETNRITDWNSILKSGFYECKDNSLNGPNNNWFWGINVGYTGNDGSTWIRNSQIVFELQTNNMFFRTTNGKGIGAWAKVLHDQGDQKIKGNLAVAGKIDAKEIQVKVDAGADHVFYPEYELTNLSDLKSFVEENKHLPDIPSEKQMQKEGLNVNEFQIKLLQKIEELTLYIIKQDETINNQSQQIEHLNQRLNQINY